MAKAGGEVMVYIMFFIGVGIILLSAYLHYLTSHGHYESKN